MERCVSREWGSFRRPRLSSSALSSTYLGGAEVDDAPLPRPTADVQRWQLSLRQVSKELTDRGFLNERGKPYAAKSVATMVTS
jgi:hypothetical protein